MPVVVEAVQRDAELPTAFDGLLLGARRQLQPRVQPGDHDRVLATIAQHLARSAVTATRAAPNLLSTVGDGRSRPVG